MMFLSVDLGTTNIKVALYSAALRCLAQATAPVEYHRQGGFVEFDAKAYLQSVSAQVASVVSQTGISGKDVAQIVLTGQAESLVVLGEGGEPLCPAISWMDERSQAECAELQQRFPLQECAECTGQRAVLPTWPATKILWLQKNRPEVSARAKQYVLLKDYIVYGLSGRLMADMSIATFSFYFDIYKKAYWPEMLAAIGITESQLPPLAEPCTIAGPLLPGIASEAGLSTQTLVNIGTLDHFAGMLGTGNIAPGVVSLSTGTVMALATMAGGKGRGGSLAMHYGFIPGSYVMLPVCESGGVCLEWFRGACLPGVSFREIDETILGRTPPEDLLFLPYIVGTNAPELDEGACGIFYGLRARHDAYDMAFAVMEGVAHLLKKNCDAIQATGTRVGRIIATGGGAKSALWCQLQADITGVPVEVPEESEAACLGAAIAGAVSSRCFTGYEQAAGQAVKIKKRYEPAMGGPHGRKHRQFCALYDAMLKVKNIK